jgi:hypothetical protein
LNKREKLIERLVARPADFTFDELAAILKRFGYSLSSTGKTGGSRVAFSNGEGDYIRLHRPHAGSALKKYQINDIIMALTERGLL